MAPRLFMGDLINGVLLARTLLVLQAKRLVVIPGPTNKPQGQPLRFFSAIRILVFYPLPAQWLTKIVQDHFFARSRLLRFLNLRRFFARFYRGDYLGQRRAIFLTVTVKNADQWAIGVRPSTNTARNFIDLSAVMQKVLNLLLHFLVQLAASFGRFNHWL